VRAGAQLVDAQPDRRARGIEDLDPVEALRARAAGV